MTSEPLSFPAQQRAGTHHHRFPRLFSPLKVGATTLKNRIVSAAHHTGFTRSGEFTDQLLAYHEERARGGTAVIVSQGMHVSPEYGLSPRGAAWYERVIGAVRPYGTKYFVELMHPGGQGDHYLGTGAAIHKAPSALPVWVNGWHWRVPQELDRAEIRSIIGAFGDAARIALSGAVDGIELHFAHGNLAEQFMSPRTNLRSDEWGGGIDNRLRFAHEVLLAVREAVGPELVVGCRLSGSQLDPGGLTQMDMMEIAGLMDEWSLLDYVSVTMGHYSDMINVARNVPDMSFRPALWASYGAAIKHIVRVPVFLVGRINHPRDAEALLTSDKCDAVVLGRALIADPRLPVKAFAGAVEDIRPCVGAMDCWTSHQRGPLRCIHNPEVGAEREWSGEVRAAEPPGTVVIVGAGPAGLECARTAALRGHTVVLFERGSRVGGQVAVAAKAPERAELQQIVDWLERQCAKLEVRLRLGEEPSFETILALAPDAVVIATGASYGIDPIVPESGARVLVGLDVLDGRRNVEGRVAIFDHAGTRYGFSVAHKVAIERHQVDFVTPTVYPGIAIDPIGWRVTYERLLFLGVRFHTSSTVVRASGTDVSVRHLFTGTEEVLEGVGTTIIAGMPRAQDRLFRALRGRIQAIHVIGDARAPRGVQEAILEGHRVGREL